MPPLMNLRDVLSEQVTRPSGSSVVPLRSTLATIMARQPQAPQQDDTADILQGLGIARQAAGLPGKARGVAEAVTGDQVARSGGLADTVDLLNTASSVFSLAEIGLNPKLSTARKALGAARGVTGLASSRPIQSVIPALKSLNAPIPGTSLPGLSTASSVLGLGLGALDIAEGRTGQGVASIVPSLATLGINAAESAATSAATTGAAAGAGVGAGALAGGALAVPAIVGMIFNAFLEPDKRRRAERKRDRAETSQQTLNEVARTLSEQPFSQAVRQPLQVGGGKTTSGGLMRSIAEANLRGEFAGGPWYWLPDEEMRRLAGSLEALGVTAEPFDHGRVNSVGELVATTLTQRGPGRAPGATAPSMEGFLQQIAARLPAEMARFAPAAMPRQQALERAMRATGVSDQDFVRVLAEDQLKEGAGISPRLEGMVREYLKGKGIVAPATRKTPPQAPGDSGDSAGGEAGDGDGDGDGGGDF